jgi:TolA-binding protein
MTDVHPTTDELLDASETPESSETAGSEEKLVPVKESIKYRRRAQQAEAQVEALEQKLTELQTLVAQRDEEMAQIEAQRDEADSQLVELGNRLIASELLAGANVLDMETAMILLAQRVDLTESGDPDAIAGAVEQLLLDKPFLRDHGSASLPGKTASGVAPHTGVAQLVDAAERAIESGDRRDVAEYLRLRRQQRLI